MRGVAFMSADGGALKNEQMDEDEEDEDDGDDEKRRADLKCRFIKGKWTREEDEKVNFPSFFVGLFYVCGDYVKRACSCVLACHVGAC